MEVGLAKKILFPSGSLYLEGILVQRNVSKAVVISHPHPLYGGDMNNYVVGLIARTFEEQGWTTLRFNFRGVGRSHGNFDQGVGEKEDVSAAVVYLRGLGMQKIVLAGYSFGAWVNAQAALNNPAIGHSILVSPPLAMMDFSFLKDDSKTILIIAGGQDPFCPSPELKKLVQAMNTSPSIKFIEDADHFYSEGSEELITAIRESDIWEN